MNKFLLPLILLFISFYSSFAQHTCGQEMNITILEEKYPGITSLINKTYENAKNSTLSTRAVYRIPVVVHVIFNSQDQNLDDAIIQSQIDVLNEDFRRLNADADQTRDVFLDVAADAEIEFYMAELDPSGNATSGITRTETDKQSFIEFDLLDIFAAALECGIDLYDPGDLSDEQLECLLEEIGGFDLDAMKDESTGGVSPWDTEKYMNIWVCNLGIDFGGESVPFLLGFAYPPIGAPNWPDGTLPDDIENKDGVVVHYQAFGRNNPEAGSLEGTNDQGRTATHEVGHYLGLRHIWGDGDCTMDDGLEDTPTAAENSQSEEIPSSCTELHSKDSCNDDSLPDMLENYMDYSIESCMNLFTNDQADLMRAMLEGPRVGLLDGAVNNDNLAFELNVVIQPNPFRSNLQIKVQNQSSFCLYNANGSKVRCDHLSEGLNEVEFAQLEAGIYFIKFNNGSKIQKLIKI